MHKSNKMLATFKKQNCLMNQSIDRLKDEHIWHT